MITEYPRIFSKICKISESLKGFLCYWDSQNGKMYLKNSLKDRHIFLHRLSVYGLVIATLFLQGSSHFQSELVQKRLTFTDQFLYAFGLLCHLSDFVGLVACYQNRVYIYLYVNGLVRFHAQHNYRQSQQTNHGPAYVSIRKLLYCSCIFAMFITWFALPIMYSYGLHWINPCKPSLAGYWLLPECHFRLHEKFGNGLLIGVLDTTLKVVIMLANHWIWVFGTNNAILTLGGLLLMCTVSLKECIEK